MGAHGLSSLGHRSFLLWGWNTGIESPTGTSDNENSPGKEKKQAIKKNTAAKQGLFSN